jgi:hypothetical protein
VINNIIWYPQHKNIILFGIASQEQHFKNHIDQQGSVPPPPVPDYDDIYLPEDGKMQQNPLLLVSQECLCL